jgi:hypothetical protein
MRKLLPLILSASLVTFAVATPAQAAPVVGVTISNDGMQVDNFPWNLGYSFIVNQAISVVSLGVWDQDSDGLLSRHEVGLWDSSGTLLASTFVGAGAVGILDNGFRFTDIAPVLLTAGQIYYVAGTFNGPGDDIWVADPTTLASAPQITYESRRYQNGSTLVFPDLAGSNTTGYWGGNFRFEDAAASPEPTTLLLIGAGLAAVRARRRRA